MGLLILKLKPFLDLRPSSLILTAHCVSCNNSYPHLNSSYGIYFTHLQYMKNAASLWIHIRRWPVNLMDAAGQPLPPKAIVFLAHGYGEHIGRYEALATFLNRAGYYVVGIDHQGHGQSDGDRAHVGKFKHFVQDYLRFLEHEQARFRQIYGFHFSAPAFLYGHSMGGLIAFNVALQSPSNPLLWPWRGVVLSSPALAVDPAVQKPLIVFVGKVSNRARVSLMYSIALWMRSIAGCAASGNNLIIILNLPSLLPLFLFLFFLSSLPFHSLHLICSAPFSCFSHSFRIYDLFLLLQLLSRYMPKLPVQTLDGSLVSSLPVSRTRYDNDPLNYRGPIRARLGIEFVQATEDARKNFAKFAAPVLVFHSEQDRLTDPQGSRDFANIAASPDKQLVLFNKSRHEILNDVESEEAKRLVLDWISKRA